MVRVSGHLKLSSITLLGTGRKNKPAVIITVVVKTNNLLFAFSIQAATLEQSMHFPSAPH
jgi:hypothetical protein